jgi:hypothetical protein
MGEEYIDTPGFYEFEKEHYSGIFDFMQSNMGLSELERLIEWHDNNPEKVKKIVLNIF